MSDDLERAIAIAEEHRAIHVSWIDYWRKHPPRTAAERDRRRYVGGIGSQQQAVRRYNIILRVLRGMRRA